MLSKIETDKILSIETTCQMLLEKCRQLRLESAPSREGALKKKTKRQIFNEGLKDYFEKKTQKLIQQSLNKP
jgi:hypothetical protein